MPATPIHLNSPSGIQKSSGAFVPFFPASSSAANMGLMLQSMKSAAVSGDTIVVGAGTYDTKNLLKNGVNWWFAAGAIIQYTGSADGSIFDDTAATGANSAVVCQIGGFGRFYQHGSLTTGLCSHVVGQGNAGSDIRIQCDEIRTTQLVINNAGPAVRQNGGSLYIDANVIDGGTLNMAVWWSDGPCYIFADELLSTCGNGAVYSTPGASIFGGTIPDTTYTNGFLWIEAQHINGIATAGPLTARVWITAKEITSVSDGNILTFCLDLSGNSVYLVGIGKITPYHAGVTPLDNSGPAKIWGTIQKITTGANAIALNDSGGIFKLDVLEIEDPNNWGTAIISCAAGNHRIGVGYIGGGTGANGIDMSGGLLEFSGYIDTSASGNSNAPVRLTSSSTGLTLSHATLKAASGANDVIIGTGTVTLRGATVDDPDNKGVKNTVTISRTTTL